ncbi:MAG TPA: hypothetical protein VG498_18810, partial [Terriglobales bacterium]|nr:hypothetical protein [Terriglobales bacterium]
MNISRRELLQRTIQTAAVVTASAFLIREAPAQQPHSKYAVVFSRLDAFIEQYMRGMNAPGMVLSMADRDGVQR